MVRVERNALEQVDFESTLANNDSRDAHELPEEQTTSLVRLDLRTLFIVGKETLQRIAFERPGTRAAVASDSRDMPAAIRCMKLGAVTYLAKPLAISLLAKPVSSALDAALVRDMDRSPTQARVVRFLHSLCVERSVEVLVGCVEMEAEVDTLVGLACDGFRGYYFGRPGPVGRCSASRRRTRFSFRCTGLPRGG